VAKLIHTSTRERYLAGLWKGDLLSGLLWRPLGDVRRRVDGIFGVQRMPRRLDSHSLYFAPTWSWAFHDGAVLFQTGPPDNELGRCPPQSCSPVFVSAAFTTVGSDFGALSGGHLRLRAPYADVSAIIEMAKYMDSTHSWVSMQFLVLPKDDQYASPVIWPDTDGLDQIVAT
jgi:hypothetical protein